MHCCEPTSYFCTEIDDYRPTQTTLLTRFATIADCSEIWRTSNQDYGAFYYRNLPDDCTADRLKAKMHRRYGRFQNWLAYQAKCNHSSSPITDRRHSYSNILPSNRNETVRITHRKRFTPNPNEQCNESNRRPDLISLSPCGEDGLITEYIVRKILTKLQCLINPEECRDVAECAQVLVSEILSEQPSLCLNEIIDRVVNIMTSPPSDPCPAQPTTVEVTRCPSAPRVHRYCQTANEIPVPCPAMNSSCNETTKIFDNLTALENAIAKLIQPSC